MPDRICICGQKFLPKRPHGRYCSTACRRRDWGLHHSPDSYRLKRSEQAIAALADVLARNLVDLARRSLLIERFEDWQRANARDLAVLAGLKHPM
jgi:hypothetical protein